MADLPMVHKTQRTALILSPILPVPEIQGNRRVIAEFVRWLAARGYRVLFLNQGAVRDPAQHEAMRKLGAEVVEVSRKTPPRRTRMWRLGRRVALETRRFDRWNRRCLGLDLQFCGLLASWEERIVHHANRECWDETTAVVHRLVKETRASVVVSEYVYSTPALVGLPDTVLTMVHTHDCLSQVWEKVGRFGIDTHAREISRGLERRCIQRARVALALQPLEAETFRRLAPGVEVVVLGFSPGPIPAKPLRVGDDPIVFFPASNNPANRAGLRWLLEHVWPRVRSGWPAARLRIAGEVSRWLGGSAEGVQALGALPDLTPEYARARLVANPVAVGTGLKIKTIEALGLGKALVSTSNGLDGLSASPEPWVRADHPQSFADALVSLGRNDDRVQQLERTALAFAQRELTTDSVFRGLAARISQHEADSAP